MVIILEPGPYLTCGHSPAAAGVMRMGSAAGERKGVGI